MCGIAGLLNAAGAPASRERLQAMAAAIAHRGPDGEGLFTDGPAGLAHRRLAIIDLSDRAAQPMHSADGRYVLSYNGEIYNYRELRRELEATGHVFRTASDSEVLLQAWVAWGPAALPRFNGMFAFALWDRQRRTMVLARDRYGIKPLYVRSDAAGLSFASEAKALRADGFRLDREALSEYLSFQNFFTGRTLFAGVQMFPPGSWAEVEAGGAAVLRPRAYWDWHFQESHAGASDEEYLEELDRLFEQAVRRQLVSDVEVGAYLSGGIDSGAITAVAARQHPYIKSFTTGFDMTSASGVELGFDERARAERMSYLFRTEHYEVVLKAGDLERVMPKLAWHLEEPRVGQSYPNMYVSRLASKFVKVVLSGAGGDEVFGGYPWRYYRAVVNDDFDHYIDKYFQFWNRLLPEGVLQQVLGPVWNDVRHVDHKAIFRGVFASHANEMQSPQEYVNHSLYFEARTFLHGLLAVEDKLAMAHGLETRLPFLDNDLVDFAMRLPVRLKLGNLGDVVRLNENEPGPKTARYFQQTRDGKLLLRRMVSRHVPDEVAYGLKQGFSAPDASWFRGESIDYVRSIVHNDQAAIYQFLDPASTRRLVDEHLRGSENRRLLIWSLISLENCFQQFGIAS
ncbi:asparagine synthase (glutamine-hydrolyzing) [Ramlibacter rhizophilus]|uniref:asparagine synthase (glutamine-hydrolyzing) n=1 Tax=Ramlibacter rhizophilus TaxID=1781167 RepID=A0A4Z0BNZ9_9BURK|nr:asparagine synthase (glutamine-hydrolyzing) [Ramlibacter rhizophilus]TFY99668.1 asparagine synthase (glutamine-hydrolyzing) [Ramlibacter rhizophilus]